MHHKKHDSLDSLFWLINLDSISIVIVSITPYLFKKFSPEDFEVSKQAVVIHKQNGSLDSLFWLIKLGSTSIVVVAITLYSV